MGNKFGSCPLCGRQSQQRNLRAIMKKNQLYGFQMALDVPVPRLVALFLSVVEEEK